MRKLLRYSLIAVPAMVLGLIGGFFGGVWTHEQNYGTPGDVFRDRATMAAYTLIDFDGAPRDADGVVAAAISNANLWTVNASQVLDRPGAHGAGSQALRQALQRLHGDPRMQVGLADDAIAMYADAARTCVTRHLDATDAVVADCARNEIARIRAGFCTNEADQETCRLPPGELMGKARQDFDVVSGL